MPSDSNGVYSLPDGYLAVTGETIQASQHNPPLEDLETAMSGRLPVNGGAPMTGVLRLTGGSEAAPGLTFASATNVGFYRTASGIGVSVNGAEVFEFTSIPQGRIIGEITEWPLTTFPTGWLPCHGASLLIAQYPDLYAVIGTTYGGSGASFNLPNLRGRVTACYDPGGGTSPLTGATTIGNALGAETKTIAQGNLPAVSLDVTIPSGQGSHTHPSLSGGLQAGDQGSGGGQTGWLSTGGPTPISPATLPEMSGTTSALGSGTALSIIQPTAVLNKIIYTGVA